MLRPLLLAVFCCAIALPAAGEETASTEEQPSSNKTFEIPNPAMADEGSEEPLAFGTVAVDRLPSH